MSIAADSNMCTLAKRRGYVWVQLDDQREVVATLVCWHDKRARVQFGTGKRRTVDTSRVRPA